MLLKDADVDGSTIGQRNDPARSTRTLNGLINPTIEIRPGETQVWRIGNIGANAYYRLQLEGHTLYRPELRRSLHLRARWAFQHVHLLARGFARGSHGLYRAA